MCVQLAPPFMARDIRHNDTNRKNRSRWKKEEEKKWRKSKRKKNQVVQHRSNSHPSLPPTLSLICVHSFFRTPQRRGVIIRFKTERHERVQGATLASPLHSGGTPHPALRSMATSLWTSSVAVHHPLAAARTHDIAPTPPSPIPNIQPEATTPHHLPY